MDCAACGTSNTTGSKFCMACGQPLVAGHEAADEQPEAPPPDAPPSEARSSEAPPSEPAAPAGDPLPAAPVADDQLPEPPPPAEPEPAPPTSAPPPTGWSPPPPPPPGWNPPPPPGLRGPPGQSGPPGRPAPPVAPGSRQAPPPGQPGWFGGPGAPAGPADPNGLGAAVARLGFGAKRSGKAALLAAAVLLDDGEMVECLVVGRMEGEAAAAVLTDRRILLVNERAWAPTVASIPVDGQLAVQGWQDGQSASLTFLARGRQDVIEAIVDKLLAVEVAGRIRSRAGTR